MSPDLNDDDTPRSLAIAEAIGAWIGTLSGHGADFRMDPIVKKALEACAGTAWDRAAEHLAAVEQDRDRLSVRVTRLENAIVFLTPDSGAEVLAAIEHSGTEAGQ